MITNRQRDRLTRDAMRLANIGKRYWRARIDDIPDDYKSRREIDIYVRDLLDNIFEGIGLLLHGPKGHGKTHIAIAILKRALSFNARGLFIPANQLQEAVIERTAVEFDNEAVPMWERARTVDLLIIDDLGEEHTRDFNNRLLENLCRYRNNRARATIFTTNLNVKEGELGQHYGEWIESVLKEMAYPIRVMGTDWREERAQDLKRRFKG